MKKISLALAFISALCLTGCSTSNNKDAVAGPPEFQDFGGKPGLVKLMDDFMVELLATPETKSFFVNADQKRVKEQLVDQFCEVLGGPCKYSGKSMEASHSGLGINKNSFNSLVESLRRTMDKHHIPNRSQNKLLAGLAPMHRNIIEKK